MAGTLTISTLSDGTNSTSSTNCIQGSAKAWVKFAGSSATIAAAYNVSSITRVSTGIYTINFSNSLANANYAPVISGTGINNGTVFEISNTSGTDETNAQTTTSFSFASRYNGSLTLGDPLAVFVVVIGN